MAALAGYFGTHEKMVAVALHKFAVAHNVETMPKKNFSDAAGDARFVGAMNEEQLRQMQGAGAARQLAIG